MGTATISFGPKLGLINNAAINQVFVDQFRQFLQAMDQLIMGSVINAVTVAPPSSPSNGDAYLLTNLPSGAWAGMQGKIAVWDTQVTNSGTNTLAPAWVFYTPNPGWIIWNAALTQLQYYNGSAWATIGTNLPTATAAGQVLTATGAGTTYTAQTPPATTMTLIQTITATAVNSLTFSAIPQTYKHLRLVCNYSMSTGNNLAINFNGDTTAAHYAYGLIEQITGSNQITQSDSSTHALLGPIVPTVAVLDIVRYAGASVTGVQLTGTFSSATIGSDTYTGTIGGAWIGTDVTSIALTEAAGAALFTVGSTFDLYGY
jgi:hypothetical protein